MKGEDNYELDGRDQTMDRTKDRTKDDGDIGISGNSM